MFKVLISCLIVALVSASYLPPKEKKQYKPVDETYDAKHDYNSQHPNDYAPGVFRPPGYPYHALPYFVPYVPYPQPYPFYGFGYGGYPYPGYRGGPSPATGGYVFVGKFQGSCKDSPDGLYYVDNRSFAFCSNGVKTIQACAEGSANSPYNHFRPGQLYYQYDFCAVNLAAANQAKHY